MCTGCIVSIRSCIREKMLMREDRFCWKKTPRGVESIVVVAHEKKSNELC